MTVLADVMTLGVWVGAGVMVLVALGCAVVIIAGLLDSTGEGLFFAACGFGTFVVAAVIYVACMWPFKYDYHHWVDKGGVVTDVSKRLVPAGDSGMQEKFVFTINGKPYGVTDTRAALVKRGDKVKIRCKKAYEWGTSYDAHGWDCKWAGAVE